MAGTDALAQRLNSLSVELAEIGSPFVSRLLGLMAADVRQRPLDGLTALLLPTMNHPPDDYHAMRALSGVHWRVLEGVESKLNAHYGSVGGDNDADAAWTAVRDVLDGHPPEVLTALGHPLQTNEPARSTALVVGLLEVAAATGLPIRLLELGSSAGLNLHLDKFRFEALGAAVGPADSPVRFVDRWRGGVPRLDATLHIVDRRGCDRDPIDLRDARERTRLLSYVLPDERERFDLNRAAVGIAANDPVTIDRADGAAWVDSELAAPLADGVVTVLMHSLVWLYLDDQSRRRIARAVERAAADATATSPMAWLRYEQADDHKAECDLRLQLWPGGDDVLLATGGHHLDPIELTGTLTS